MRLHTRNPNRSNRDLLAARIVIRQSTAADAVALAELAALEARPLPHGPFLVAELDGTVVAAAPLDGQGPPLADPFRPTADLAELLRLRVRRLQGSPPLRRAA